MLQVYDLKNKLVAYSARIAGAPKWLLSGSDRALVVAAGGAVVALREQPLAFKLQLLYRKQLYPTALALLQAQPHGFEPAVLADIHRQYAEHLYAKADYGGAVDQWVLTLGEVQPCAVLRRLLDIQHIGQLARYLQARQSVGTGMGMCNVRVQCQCCQCAMCMCVCVPAGAARRPSSARECRAHHPACRLLHQAARRRGTRRAGEQADCRGGGGRRAAAGVHGRRGGA
jgi:hypothetical protein